MSAIITEKFRQHNANQFVESFTETALNKYYLFLGKATPFTSGTTTGSDGIPPIPGDSPSEEFRARNSSEGLSPGIGGIPSEPVVVPLVNGVAFPRNK